MEQFELKTKIMNELQNKIKRKNMQKVQEERRIRETQLKIEADQKQIKDAEKRIQANQDEVNAAQRSIIEIDREREHLFEQFLNVELTD
jgi:hypothetical protein